MPRGYAEAFGPQSTCKSEWYVRRSEYHDQLNESLNAWRDGKDGTTVLILGECGVGKSLLLKGFFEENNIEAKISTLMPGDHANDVLLPRISRELTGSTEDTKQKLMTKLRSLPPSVFVIENLANIVLRSVGGFSTYMSLLDVVMATADKHFWIATATDESWRFIKQAFHGSECFSRTIHISTLDEDQVRELVLKRHESEHAKLDFSAISFKDTRKNRSQRQYSDDEKESRARRLYFRMLWDYTGGNPRNLMYFWGTSIQLHNGIAMVHLFDVPESGILENLSDDALFLLASLVEHNGLSLKEICSVLSLHPETALLLLEQIAAFDIIFSNTESREFNIESFWAPAVKSYLTRRNLLFGGGR